MRSTGRDMTLGTSTSSIKTIAGTSARGGFTLPELLVVTGVIALLVGIILAALSGAKQTANMTKAQARLKDIATYMRDYSAENREFIVPSQFDYANSANNFAVKVRSNAALPAGERYVGTWTDILWTQNGLGKRVVDPTQSSNPDKYLFDSPDRALYQAGEADWSPFRSSERNTRDYGGPGAGVPTPFGAGATENGLPGYFAANDFFNANANSPGFNGWYATGQIKAPDKSMYVVDSVAGETIRQDPAVNGPWDNPSYTFTPDGSPGAPGAAAPNLEVDFRYNGQCLMLLLDGHVSSEGPWRNLDELEGRSASATNKVVRVKVRDLDKR